MNSLILRTIAVWLLPVLVLASLFLFLRGHDAPGGGFSGGLIAAAGYVLLALACGPAAACRALPVAPQRLLGGGLTLVAISALAPVVIGEPPLTGLWTAMTIGEQEKIHLGTPLLFDAGIYLVVIGAVAIFMIALTRKERRWTSS
jgi:multicomponent Na+:H+ antiporter subunit B